MRARYNYRNRWRKPRLYLTSAACFLLLSLALSAVFFSIHEDGSFALPDEDSASLTFGGFIRLTAQGWLLILSIPTFLGAASLLRARKLGIFISLGILPLMAFTLGMSVFFALGDSRAEMLGKLLIDFSIASVMAMLGPLLLGWKQMPWTLPRRSVRTNAMRQKR